VRGAKIHARQSALCRQGHVADYLARLDPGGVLDAVRLVEVEDEIIPFQQLTGRIADEHIAPGRIQWQRCFDCAVQLGDKGVRSLFVPAEFHARIIDESGFAQGGVQVIIETDHQRSLASGLDAAERDLFIFCLRAIGRPAKIIPGK